MGDSAYEFFFRKAKITRIPDEYEGKNVLFFELLLSLINLICS